MSRLFSHACPAPLVQRPASRAHTARDGVHGCTLLKKKSASDPSFTTPPTSRVCRVCRSARNRQNIRHTRAQMHGHGTRRWHARTRCKYSGARGAAMQMRGRCLQVRQPDAVEKVYESLERRVKHVRIVDRKVWTSPLAIQNHASNRYHGADTHFLQTLRYEKPMVDFGKVIARSPLPVRRRMQASNKDCTPSQRSRSLQLPQGFPSCMLRGS
jgi:hypothetical protein